MYMLEEMIDYGLKPGQDWPSPAHRQVAMAIGLCNGQIRTKDDLIAVVQSVVAIPANRIETVTFGEAAKEFRVPFATT